MLADKKGKETVAKFAKFKADQARVGGAQVSSTSENLIPLPTYDVPLV